MSLLWVSNVAPLLSRFLPWWCFRCCYCCCHLACCKTKVKFPHCAQWTTQLLSLLTCQWSLCLSSCLRLCPMCIYLYISQLLSLSPWQFCAQHYRLSPPRRPDHRLAFLSSHGRKPDNGAGHNQRGGPLQSLAAGPPCCKPGWAVSLHCISCIGRSGFYFCGINFIYNFMWR